MAREVIWRQGALDDLESIWRHIARDSETYAAAVAARIVTMSETLTEHAYIGHRVEQIERADVREISVFPYRMFYSIDDRAITILVIAHGARDLGGDLLKSRLT